MFPFSSSDLAIFDGFGDDPQEEDEDKDGKDKEGEKNSDEKDKKSGEADASPVDDVAAAVAATSLTTGAKEGAE